MTFSARPIRCVLGMLCCALLSGCLPPGRSELDETREPHFLAGKGRVNGMDYMGAIESFEKALEVNPRSAAAHLELAWLFHEKAGNPAAAIYHYERFLRLRPKAENADILKQRIYVCKQDLAKGVLPLPTTPGMQREFDQLVEENKALREEVTQWRNYYAATRAALATNVPVQPLTSQPATTPAPTPQTQAVAAPRIATPETHAAAPAPIRTHTVKSGETLTMIARKYGVQVDALMAANPRLEPRRMQIGQTLNIPSR